MGKKDAPASVLRKDAALEQSISYRQAIAAQGCLEIQLQNPKCRGTGGGAALDGRAVAVDREIKIRHIVVHQGQTVRPFMNVQRRSNCVRAS